MKIKNFSHFGLPFLNTKNKPLRYAVDFSLIMPSSHYINVLTYNFFLNDIKVYKVLRHGNDIKAWVWNTTVTVTICYSKTIKVFNYFTTQFTVNIDSKYLRNKLRFTLKKFSFPSNLNILNEIVNFPETFANEIFSTRI